MEEKRVERKLILRLRILLLEMVCAVLAWRPREDLYGWLFRRKLDLERGLGVRPGRYARKRGGDRYRRKGQ